MLIICKQTEERQSEIRIVMNSILVADTIARLESYSGPEPDSQIEVTVLYFWIEAEYSLQQILKEIGVWELIVLTLTTDSCNTSLIPIMFPVIIVNELNHWMARGRGCPYRLIKANLWQDNVWNPFMIGDILLMKISNRKS